VARAATAFPAALDARLQRRAVFAFTDADHIHSVWHDPRNGSGADLLRAHYQMGPHPG
jgi:hypothetical protein